MVLGPAICSSLTRLVYTDGVPEALAFTPALAQLQRLTCLQLPRRCAVARADTTLLGSLPQLGRLGCVFESAAAAAAAGLGRLQACEVWWPPGTAEAQAAIGGLPAEVALKAGHAPGWRGLESHAVEDDSEFKLLVSSSTSCGSTSCGPPHHLPGPVTRHHSCSCVRRLQQLGSLVRVHAAAAPELEQRRTGPKSLMRLFG